MLSVLCANVGKATHAAAEIACSAIRAISSEDNSLTQAQALECLSGTNQLLASQFAKRINSGHNVKPPPDTELKYYKCYYCTAEAKSSSCKIIHVEIRCECRGKGSDGRYKKHKRWTLVDADTAGGSPKAAPVVVDKVGGLSKATSPVPTGETRVRRAPTRLDL